MAPAGLFIGRDCEDGSIEIELDYVIPQYRDLKVARFLYSERSEIFNEMRHRRIWTEPGSEAHVEYFKRLGFTEAADGPRRVLETAVDDLIAV